VPRSASQMRPELRPVIVPRHKPRDPEAHADELAERLSRHVAGRLSVALTDNESTMISVKREKGLYHLRLHHMFADAEPAVVQALGRYVRSADQEASQLLGRFIDINQRKIRRARRRRPPAKAQVVTAGAVHDLDALFDALDERYFDGAIRARDVRITWGPRLPSSAPRRRASIRLGSYAVEDKLIRMHRTLDREEVPRFFVEWTLFHEMLHAKHDIPVVDGRRQYHTDAFRAEEDTFDDAELARRYERDQADFLLTF